jgi:hypothetical protein
MWRREVAPLATSFLGSPGASFAYSPDGAHIASAFTPFASGMRAPVGLQASHFRVVPASFS